MIFLSNHLISGSLIFSTVRALIFAFDAPCFVPATFGLRASWGGGDGGGQFVSPLGLGLGFSTDSVVTGTFPIITAVVNQDFFPQQLLIIWLAIIPVDNYIKDLHPLDINSGKKNKQNDWLKWNTA